METTEDGRTILAEEGSGVEDPVADALHINSTKYEEEVQEQLARKKIPIVAPVKGISRQEYVDGMLRPDEEFKTV